jgi:hypothetical protein
MLLYKVARNLLHEFRYKMNKEAKKSEETAKKGEIQKKLVVAQEEKNKRHQALQEDWNKYIKDGGISFKNNLKKTSTPSPGHPTVPDLSKQSDPLLNTFGFEETTVLKLLKGKKLKTQKSEIRNQKIPKKKISSEIF